MGFRDDVRARLTALENRVLTLEQKLVLLGDKVSQNTTDCLELRNSLLDVAGQLGSLEARVAILETPPVPEPKVEFGSSAPFDQFQTAVGVPLQTERIYYRSETSWPRAILATQQGRRPVVSFNFRAGGTQTYNYNWTDVVAGKADAMLRTFVGEVNKMALPPYLGYYHEPEDDSEKGFGTPESYAAAWRYIVDFMRANGLKEGTQWVTGFMGWSLAPASGRDLERFWPGDDYVDLSGFDVYGWGNCTSNGGVSTRALGPVSSLMQGPLDFSRKHGKPFALLETGCAPVTIDPEARPNWVEELHAFVKAAQPDMRMVQWFEHSTDDGFQCDWSLSNDPATAAAFRAMVEDLA